MNETAPDRLTRMLALVAYLRDHPAVDVSDVAAHFGISEAQVMADVHTLWVSGTPGYMPGDLIDFAGDDLDHGVLTLIDSREMDRPLRLSSAEAAALLVALQSLSAALATDDPLVQETISVLRDASGEAARAADAFATVPAPQLDERVSAIREAIADRYRVRIEYVSATDTTTTRDVDPIQLLTDGQHWFLVGWCHRAQDVRQFRLDRILRHEVLPVRASEHPSVAPRERSEPDARRGTQVRLELAARARWVAEQLPSAKVTELENGWFAVTLGVVEDAWLETLVLGLGDAVRAVEPPEVAGALRGRAQDGLDAYAAFDL